MKNRSAKFIFIILAVCLVAALLAMGAFASAPEDGEETSPSPTMHTITCQQTDNGWVAVNKSPAAEGETITITAYPNQGYEPVSYTHLTLPTTERV